MDLEKERISAAQRLYNKTCAPDSWAHARQVCDTCRALVYGLAKVPEGGHLFPYQTCKAYCLSQQGGYDCISAALAEPCPLEGANCSAGCYARVHYPCDFDIGQYSDNALCTCGPTAARTQGPPKLLGDTEVAIDVNDLERFDHRGGDVLVILIATREQRGVQTGLASLLR